MRVLYFLPILILSLLNTVVHAQVKIGNNPNVVDPASMLELESPSKAFYMTRVALTSTTDLTTVPNPKAGMMVYNTNAGITATTTHPAGMPGIGVYYFDGTAWVATACCNSSWLLLGNAGTVDGTNFLGTTDNVPLNFRVNNLKSGRIEPDISTGNVSFGYQSQLSITTNGSTGIGTFNTSVGNYTLQVNTTGRRNAAFGYDALGANTTGDSNSAFGFGALQVNTTGYNNTATGAYALNHNTIGKFNVADGYEALHTNIQDSALTAVGAYSLYYNNGGKYNTATGFRSLFTNSTGSANTANGFGTLTFNYIGRNNAVFGADAGFQNNNPLLGGGSNGNNNTFIGTGADSANVLGNNNTALGYQAGYTNNGSNNTYLGAATGSTSGTLTYSGAIGSGAVVCSSNSLALGATDAGSGLNTSVNVGIDVCDPTQRIDFRNGHIRNRQDNLPAVVLTTPSGISSATLTPGSSDVRGTINTGATNNASAFTQIRVNFTYAATNAPIVTITPASEAASTASFYVTSDINGFNLFFRVSFSTSLTGALFNYMIIE